MIDRWSTTLLVRVKDRTDSKAVSRSDMEPHEHHVVCAVFSLEPGVLTYGVYTGFFRFVDTDWVDVIDARTSRYWKFRHCELTYRGLPCPSGFHLGYPEFVDDDEHRAALFDREPHALALFRDYVERFTLEFSLPFIREKAKLIEPGWVMCARCDDAWEAPSTQDEMLRCPKCLALQHRP